MEAKDISKVSSSIRSTFQKAQEVCKRGSTDYAIELLKSIVKNEPAFTMARELLREQEQVKLGKMSAIKKTFSAMKTAMLINKGKGKLKKDPRLAMNIAEDALAICLDTPGALNLLADAAIKCDAYFIAIDTLELFKEMHPNNEQNLRRLADMYYESGNAPMKWTILQQLADLRPGDLEIEAEVRQAAAQASLQKGQWEKEGSTHDKVKDKDQARQLEQEERVARNIDDVTEMIERYQQEIEGGNESIDIRRKLIELFQRAERFDEAIETCNWMVEKMGTMDPNIDKEIEKATTGKLILDINALEEQKAQDAENSEAYDAKIQEIEQQIYQYQLERAVDRVNHYPNDTELRYSLALVYWNGGYIDEALEQFQIAQKSPHRKIQSLVYLGRCFNEKKQYDLAVQQYQAAISNMGILVDKQKMEALYYLGLTYDKMGNEEDAKECFKTIYQANINYRDVKARMEKYYSNN